MILSVSRRTDIPSFYMDWFLNRLQAGWVLTRNPFNHSSVSKITLTPASIECIVFWTKNPAPMLDRLKELRPYPFYVQYTLNPYARDMESKLPDLEQRLAVFKRLAGALGPEQVVWRYSPVLLTSRYTENFHLKAFARLSRELAPYTRRCHLSFLDMYAKIAPRLRKLGVLEQSAPQMSAMAAGFAKMAATAGIELTACGGPDLLPVGVAPASCVDGKLIAELTGRDMSFKKDSGQRAVCNCVESVDIGSYQTCLNGCAYCYANHSHAAALRRAALHDPDSPFLCDSSRPGDALVERKIRQHARPGQNQLPF